MKNGRPGCVLPFFRSLLPFAFTVDVAPIAVPVFHGRRIARTETVRLAELRVDQILTFFVAPAVKTTFAEKVVFAVEEKFAELRIMLTPENSESTNLCSLPDLKVSNFQ